MGARITLPQLAYWKAQVKCQAGCPVATDAGRYVQLAAEGRLEEAYLVARAPNPFASVCGRVCAAPCEDVCRRSSIDAPVAIRALKRHLTEQYGVESMRPDTQDRLRTEELTEGNRYGGHLPLTLHRQAPTSPPAVPRKVAIIGARPAGLAAAHDLALLGYAVTIFEAADEPGGMMRYGIPEYRLPRALLRAEIDRILALGVTLRLQTPLTADFGLAALKRAGFDATFLAVGVSRGRDLQAPGVELDGVVKAVDYLLNVNKGYRLNLGRRVVVVGGGFVAFDAARTALRIGRESGLDQADVDRLAAAADARMKEAVGREGIQWLGIGLLASVCSRCRWYASLSLCTATARSSVVSGIRLDNTISIVPIGAWRKSSSERPNRFGTSSTAAHKSGAVTARFQMP
jgi:NADPH-dependent glutamate synthase beta subunit-like oxidoreductase